MSNDKKFGLAKKYDYIFWHDESIVDDYIHKFLKSKFPGCLIIPEFTMIDWFVIDENLPIEIQSTIIKVGVTPAHSYFENKIRQSLEQNISIYGKCWFFFDDAYLRYLQNDIEKNISINLDWLYKLIKANKIRIFTVTYDGKIEEKKHEDFEFIGKFSGTCILGECQDSRILQKNKALIFNNVLKSNDITSDEIIILRKRLLNIKHDQKLSRGAFYNFGKYCDSDKDKLICKIYKSMGDLELINKGLDCNYIEENVVPTHVLYYFDLLGLTEYLYGANKYMIRRFIDIDNISTYFPGYLRNKEKWDYLKDSKTKLNTGQLYAIIARKVNPLDWKKLIHVGW